MSELAGRVVALADLLDYQEGAVVSRTIIDKPTGTVTLFAFDEGQGLSEHTAPFDALVHVLEGEAAITVSGQESCRRTSRTPCGRRRGSRCCWR
jgi:quercetin dioxygenase-like cupin family protein